MLKKGGGVALFIGWKTTQKKSKTEGINRVAYFE